MTKEQKALAAIGAVVLMYLAPYVWITGDKELHVPIVSGTFTLCAAGLAAYVVFWQLRKQADNAAATNLHSEKLKLKKQVYEEVADACREIFDCANAMEQYAVGSYSEASQQKLLYELDMKDMAKPMEHRYTKLIDHEMELFKKVNEIIRILSRWEVIDPRMRVFKFAMNAALHEVREGMKEYNIRTLGVLPMDDATFEKFGWVPPKDEVLAKLSDTTDLLRDGITYVRYWVMDLQAAMQNELLGELFNSKVKPRMENPEHAARVLTLENEKELIRWMLEETRWGNKISPNIIKGPPSSNDGGM